MFSLSRYGIYYYSATNTQKSRQEEPSTEVPRFRRFRLKESRHIVRSCDRSRAHVFFFEGRHFIVESIARGSSKPRGCSVVHSIPFRRNLRLSQLSSALSSLHSFCFTCALSQSWLVFVAFSLPSAKMAVLSLEGAYRPILAAPRSAISDYTNSMSMKLLWLTFSFFVVRRHW